MIGDDDLRDCFAMFALNGLLNEATNDFNDQAIAELAYSLADAMMEARKGKDEAGIAGIGKRKYVRKSYD
jgi:hypothetical protein